MGSIAIHCNNGVEWQAKRAPQFLAGLKSLGIQAYITDNRHRETDVAVLLGTTFWRDVEATGKYLLVDRASIGDPNYVQLVWNGHGRRGNHCVPKELGRRQLDIKPAPWNTSGRRIVLCGQTETYSPHYETLDDWYEKVGNATYFRPHPAGENPTGLPQTRSWHNVKRAIALNSSIAVDAVLNGIPAVTMDEAAMAWDVTSHDPCKTVTPDRREWLNWIAYTQWHWSEIEAGRPIKHLFEAI